MPIYVNNTHTHTHTHHAQAKREKEAQATRVTASRKTEAAKQAAAAAAARSKGGAPPGPPTVPAGKNIDGTAGPCHRQIYNKAGCNTPGCKYDHDPVRLAAYKQQHPTGPGS